MVYACAMCRVLASAVLSAASLFAQNSDRETRTSVAAPFGFEGTRDGTLPEGWRSNFPETVFLDSSAVHTGKYAVRIVRTAASSGRFSNIDKALPVDFTGASITLRGFIRTAELSGHAELVLRIESDTQVSFGDMSNQRVRGTNDWKQYSITQRLDPSARAVRIGFQVNGTGTGWVDDLELLIDGRPVAAVSPGFELERPGPEDHEFDKGSGLRIGTLSAVQVENLTLLGQVWGFLKYHHPHLAGGNTHWDYQLLRVLPSVLAAKRQERDAVLLKFVRNAGPVAECERCSTLSEKNLHIRPSLDWIADRRRLGSELSAALVKIHRNRPLKQFYVTKTAGTGNARFAYEPDYRDIVLPDQGFQLLALYRVWNMVEYWFPYRDIIGENWHGVLARSIAPFALARTPYEYRLEMMRFIAALNDTHATLGSPNAFRPPVGDCQLPVSLRFIEGRPVVWAYLNDDAGRKSGLRRGDAVLAIGGRSVDDLVKEWTPLYAASNAPTRLRDIGWHLSRGACGPVELKILRAGATSEVATDRLKPSNFDQSLIRNHELGGEPFRLLSPDVAYLRASALLMGDVERFMDVAKATKGIVIDIRSYPRNMLIYKLGGRFVAKATGFATQTEGDLGNPGAFHFGNGTDTVQPVEPRYTGKVTILVDEGTQSAAEYHAMAFRAVGGVVVGSTTAGADGNISHVVLPGNASVRFSGLGVFYPDRRPTQRVGIVPDVVALPTIAGVAAGRDEVVEAALRIILGAEAPDAELRRIAQR